MKGAILGLFWGYLGAYLCFAHEAGWWGLAVCQHMYLYTNIEVKVEKAPPFIPVRSAQLPFSDLFLERPVYPAARQSYYFYST